MTSSSTKPSLEQYVGFALGICFVSCAVFSLPLIYFMVTADPTIGTKLWWDTLALIVGACIGFFSFGVYMVIWVYRGLTILANVALCVGALGMCLIVYSVLNLPAHHLRLG